MTETITLRAKYDPKNAITEVYADFFPESIRISGDLIDCAHTKWLQVNGNEVTLDLTNGRAVYRIIKTETFRCRAWTDDEQWSERTEHIAERISLELKDD